MTTESNFHTFPQDWPMLKIGEFADVKGGKRLPKGSSLTNSSTPHPYIRVVDFNNGRIEHSNLLFVPNDVFPKISRYIVSQNDVVISIVGTIGLIALIDDNLNEANLTENAAKICNVRQQVDKKYLSYFLRSFWGQEEIKSQTVGSTQPKLALFRIKDINVPIPSLPEQKAIAHILGSLDDKIELNRRMNETLEAMARAIFKSWFVDFDPVRAKAEGRKPYGMNTETAALFPDSFQDSPLGKIPKGWDVKPAGETIKAVGGGTPSTKNPSYWENGIHSFTTPKDLSKLSSPILLDTERKVTDEGLRKISSGLLPPGTLLLSSRAPVGYLAIARVPVCVNQGFIAMICNETVSNYYMLNWAIYNMDEIKSRASGTTFAEISKRNFRPMPILIPRTDVMSEFNDNVCPLYEKITSNLIQSQTLATIRDTLLPKLMSGKIRVKDAEKFI